MKSLVNQGSDNRDSRPGCSKVDSTIQGCQQQQIPPTWLVLAGYSAWHFSMDGVFLNKISLDWPLTLTTQPSSSKLSDNTDYPPDK